MSKSTVKSSNNELVLSTENIFYKFLKRYKIQLYSSLIIILSLIIFLLLSISYSLITPVFHLDGAFQTASGLFRLEDGYSIGRDFFPYLGASLLYLLYPIYKATSSFGSLFASLFSSHFITFSLVAFSVAFMSFLFFKKRSFLIFAITYLIFALIICLQMFFHPYGVLLSDEMLLPSNSLRSIRFVMPFILLSFTYFMLFYVKINEWIKYIFIILFIAFATFWSNDFAIPTVFFTIVFLIYYFYMEKKLTLKLFFFFFFSIPIVSFIYLMLITDGNGIDLIKYNFVDVKSGQHWYYVITGQLTYLESIFRYVLRAAQANLVLIILLIIFKRDKSYANLILLLLGLSVYFAEMLATVGSNNTNIYSTRIHFFANVMIVFLIVRFIYSRVIRSASAKFLHVANKLKSVILYLLPILMIAIAISLAVYTQNKIQTLQSSSDYYYVEEFGNYVDINYKDYVIFARENKDKVVAEEYFGLFSAITRNYANMPTDSLIHAFHNTRDRYIKSMHDKYPDIIITTNPNYSVWQTWSFAVNFWFYRIILENYTLSYNDFPSTVVWFKNPNNITYPLDNSSIICDVHNGYDASIYITDVLQRRAFEIKLVYAYQDIHTRSTVFIRDSFSLYGHTPIDPYGTQAYLPVISKQASSKMRFDLTINSGYGDTLSQINLISCEARAIPINKQYMLLSN